MSFASSPLTAAQPQLLRQYLQVRELSEAIADPLSAEDRSVQSMPDASPTKWHLAHTTWFFERMVLARSTGHEPFDSRFDALFNSYYLGVGQPFARGQRGLLSRPGIEEISAYRAHVDDEMESLLVHAGPKRRALTSLGLHHEQQHQELMLTDIKHAFFMNPLRPAYRKGTPPPAESAPSLDWISHEGGLVEIGHEGSGFAFDNESGRHAVHLEPFKIAARPVSCGEFQAFIDDGGYRYPEFWFADGWVAKELEGWDAPLYWLPEGNIFTLQGTRPRTPGEAVAHVSYYEAAAYAAWAGKRLPSEEEWEAVASRVPCEGNFLEFAFLHPRALGPEPQFLGDVWNWTRSAYHPYPGFRPFDGALAEYNGKFMVGQMVLRGGSCVTPPGHMRATYRNFFPPSARWQFSGIRLACDS